LCNFSDAFIKCFGIIKGSPCYINKSWLNDLSSDSAMTNGEQVSSPFADIVNPYLSPLSTCADLNFIGGIEFHIRSIGCAEKRSAEVYLKF
jgi:hypothetical protein